MRPSWTTRSSRWASNVRQLRIELAVQVAPASSGSTSFSSVRAMPAMRSREDGIISCSPKSFLLAKSGVGAHLVAGDLAPSVHEILADTSRELALVGPDGNQAESGAVETRVAAQPAAQHVDVEAAERLEHDPEHGEGEAVGRHFVADALLVMTDGVA